MSTDVGRSNIYVGIFAWRYGFIPEEDNPDQRSITELEYRHACECGVAALIFILDKDASWPMTYVDRGEESKRIDSLRTELTKSKTVSFLRIARLKICGNTADSNNTIEAAVKDIDELLIEKPELTPDVDQLKSKLSSAVTVRSE